MKSDIYDSRHYEDFGYFRSFFSVIPFTTIGLASKLLLYGLNETEFIGKEKYYSIINNQENSDRGLLTLFNHCSVIDEPLLSAAIVPQKLLLQPRKIRYAVCDV